MEMTKMSFNIAYKKKNSYYIVIGKFIYFIGFARFVFAETKKALEALRFPMLFSYPVTQFFDDCYTNCYAADPQLPMTDEFVAHRKRDRQTVLVAQP